MKIIECAGSHARRGKGTNITQTEICRRHQSVFGKDNQNRISDLAVGVVSTGGLGSIIIEQIMRLFPRKLIYIDKDNVELSNLNRLVGATKIDARLQTLKVDVISRNILSLNPNQELTAIYGDFLDQENQEQFKECDFIFGASDSNAVRIATNCLCLAHGIPYLDCGVGAVIHDGSLKAAGGQIIKVVPDSGFCLQCGELFDVSEAMKEFLPESERIRLEDQGYIRGEHVVAPQVYSLNMIVASWAVWTFMRIVSGETLQFDGIAIDAEDFSTHTWKEDIKAKDDCPTCGRHGIVFAGDDADLLTKEAIDVEVGVNSLERLDTAATSDRYQVTEVTEMEQHIPFYTDFVIGRFLGVP